MRGIQTPVSEIRHKIFTEIARVAYESYQTDYPLRLPKRMKRSCFHEVKVDWLPVWTHFRFPTKNIGLDGLEYALTTKKVKRKSLLDWKE